MSSTLSPYIEWWYCKLCKFEICKESQDLVTKRPLGRGVVHVCRLSARNIQSSHPSHTMLSWLNESYCKKILKVSGNPARVISKANKQDGLDREQTGKLARRASATCRDEGADGGVPTKVIRLNTQLPRIMRRRVPTVPFFSQYSHSSQPWNMAHWIFSHWQLFPPQLPVSSISVNIKLVLWHPGISIDIKLVLWHLNYVFRRSVSLKFWVPAKPFHPIVFSFMIFLYRQPMYLYLHSGGLVVLLTLDSDTFTILLLLEVLVQYILALIVLMFYWQFRLLYWVSRLSSISCS